MNSSNQKHTKETQGGSIPIGGWDAMTGVVMITSYKSRRIKKLQQVDLRLQLKHTCTKCLYNLAPINKVASTRVFLQCRGKVDLFQ